MVLILKNSAGNLEIALSSAEIRMKTERAYDRQGLAAKAYILQKYDILQILLGTFHYSKT